MTRTAVLRAVFSLLIACSVALPGPVAAAAAFQTGLAVWRAADRGFADWERAGVALRPDGRLELADADGEATSPETATSFGAIEAIPSWNVDTPPGGWVEVFLRARVGGRWTAWYALGVWAPDDAVVRRHSVARQRDDDGQVLTDTLRLNAPADALQLRLRLHGTPDALPVVRNAAIAYSTAPTAPPDVSTGDRSLWRGPLPVPACSQMVYPDGGRAWCSPTSTSMVLSYWRQDDGPCEPRVRAAVAGVYDAVYRGHGNWPFNVAYAASQGFEGYVARYGSLADLEPWLAAGVPVVFSFAWGPDELAGAPQPSVSGHLAVLVGFDAKGNPIVNDPAAYGDANVPRTYRRAQLEPLWLERGGGTVYLIFPDGRFDPGAGPPR